MTRQTKTPRQRAEEALAAAQRRRKRIADKLTTARAQVTTLQTELDEANRRLDYAQADPALPEQPARPAGVRGEHVDGPTR